MDKVGSQYCSGYIPMDIPTTRSVSAKRSKNRIKVH